MNASHGPAAVIALLGAQGRTLGTCESLTGGGVAQALSGVPGASAVLRGGLVTYASDLKASLAGVDPDWIARHGVINRETAEQMARGARRLLGVDVALSCTGVAGPDGQDGELPGTVWIAVCGPESGRLTSELLCLHGDRESVRQQTVQAGLALVERVCRAAEW
ncbi:MULTISPECIES: CinA family protein [unclassified Luteococcus]|uniref:CinA family protein n=1 Tax=unclassified Luteococcus TaxID=2639923 RepID=UPI00313E6237